jgi:hypothetical protein
MAEFTASQNRRKKYSLPVTKTGRHAASTRRLVPPLGDDYTPQESELLRQIEQCRTETGERTPTNIELFRLAVKRGLLRWVE